MTDNPCALINDEPEKERERYLTTDEQERMLQVMVCDLDYIRVPFEVSLHTGLRKNVELLKLKVGHLNFTSHPIFFPIHGGNVEIPSNWLIVVSGKRGKYRLIPMNSIARAILSRVADDRSPDAFVFDKDTNGVNEYWIDKGFEDACDLAGGLRSERLNRADYLARFETNLCNQTASTWSSRVRHSGSSWALKTGSNEGLCALHAISPGSSG